MQAIKVGVLFLSTVVLGNAIIGENPLEEDFIHKPIIDPLALSQQKQEAEERVLSEQAKDVKQRYQSQIMCAEDVLCAMDPAVTGAVSSELREKEEGSTEMHEKGLNRCVDVSWKAISTWGHCTKELDIPVGTVLPLIGSTRKTAKAKIC